MHVKETECTCVLLFCTFDVFSYVVSARLAWDPQTSAVHVLDIDKNSLSDDRSVNYSPTLAKLAMKSPSWITIQKIKDKLRIPSDNPLHVLTNMAFIQRELANLVMSYGG